MNDLLIIQNQIRNKLLANISEGVERFPAPVSSDNTPTFPSLNLGHIIQNCTACPLAKERKRVVVNSSFSSKEFFILSDFPDKYDEDAPEVFAPQSPLSSLVINLLGKLGIIENCHFSFALKCLPHFGILENSLTLCAQKNLALELSEVKPLVILCFGYRAFNALSALDSSLIGKNKGENEECSHFTIGNLTTRLFFLSSLRDLRDFPQWRKQVWQVLAPLGSGYQISTR